MMFSTLISLSSFGAAELLRHGQSWCTALAAEAGADSVEVRGELLRDAARELPELRGRAAVYSSPEGLWRADGTLDTEALALGLSRADALAAPRLKMAIGGFDAGRSRGSLAELRARLQAQSAVELLIENDQTVRAGTLSAMQRFVAAQADAGLQLGLTFDMGNWHWLGECPLQAARALAPHVRYVHAKGVFRRPDKWVAVPLAQSSAPWRAVLRELPADVPHAIEYPLVGDDLLAVTRAELAQLRALHAERSLAHDLA
ncbi:glutamine ABC transporter ATP-binding protein [Xenophilus arseniciresistens]|uniref:Glutamine ABC transporter ATP-binding protein n=1 Tax=Xenophilus arseniciresistens TaxID=1283306 RepID=A0AAE3N762_9BURK|nr:glutamine ABC transporter ATP-binding protein [Xenophilus arseniciresistens]MDA7416401.1 glutamine ABC transporter ATP-binding protein [Xenophilus arseniciresistens]